MILFLVTMSYLVSGYTFLFSGKKRNQNDVLIIFVKQHLIADFFNFNLLDYNIVMLSFHYNNVSFIILCIYV